MRNVLYRLVAGAGLPGAWRALRPGVTILTYHGFTDRHSFDGVIDHQRMRLHVDAFRKHLEHLVSHYRVLSLASLVSLYRDGRPVPERAVIITFDDGYRSCYTLAHPLLKEFGAPATLFVATDFVYGRRPLWHDRVEYALHSTCEPLLDLEVAGETRRYPCGSVSEKIAALRFLYRVLKRIDQRERDVVIDGLEQHAGSRLELGSGCPEVYVPVELSELREMVSDGLLDVGSHTKTHAVLSRCCPGQTETEIVESRAVIEGSLSRACDLFCYPNGTRLDFDDRTRQALVEAGFRCALTTVPGKNGAGADPMELRRVSAPAGVAEFSMAASGLRADVAVLYAAAKRALGRFAADGI